MKDMQSQLEELAQEMTSSTIRAFNCIGLEEIDIILDDGSSIIVHNSDRGLEIFHAAKPKSTIVTLPKLTRPEPIGIEPGFFEHFDIPINDPSIWKYNFSQLAKNCYIDENVLLGVKDEIKHWLSKAIDGIPFNEDSEDFPLPEQASEYRARVYIAHIYSISENDILILEGIKNE